jgi:hypothetical protein
VPWVPVSITAYFYLVWHTHLNIWLWYFCYYFFTRFSTKLNSPCVVPFWNNACCLNPLCRGGLKEAPGPITVPCKTCSVLCVLDSQEQACSPIGIRLVPSLCKMVTTANTGKMAIHYMCSLLEERVNINKYSLGFKHSVVPTNICLHFIISVLLVEETRVPLENHWPAASHRQT